MLAFKQHDNEPLVIGNAVIVIVRDGDGFKVCVDAPRSVQVKRGDIVLADLEEAGYASKGHNSWADYTGKLHTTYQALAKIGKLG